MTYAEAEDFLFYSLTNYLRTGNVSGGENKAKSVVPGERRFLPSRAKILQMLARLDHPHAAADCDYLHVAGTNGKGTVSNAIAAMLHNGLKLMTGLYTSPHYVHYNERIRVNGEPISEAEIVAFVEMYSADMIELRLSFFEATAALAFWYFRKTGCQAVVLEVGMGGTWDATNVIRPTVSVITNIGLDHQRELGDTISAISAEKAGIIKAGVPVVVGRRQPETHPVFAALSAGMHAPLIYATDMVKVSQSVGLSTWRLSVSTTGQPADQTLATDFEAALDGPFAEENLMTAIAAISRYIDVVEGSMQSLKQAVSGLAALASWGYVGRFTRIAKSPNVIVDAGHNAAAWQATLPMLTERAMEHSLVVICGFKQGKDPSAFFEHLPQGCTVVVVQSKTLGSDPAQVLAKAEVVMAIRDRELVAGSSADLAGAIASAMHSVGPHGTVFIGGSSYLVGDALALHASTTLPA